MKQHVGLAPGRSNEHMPIKDVEARKAYDRKRHKGDHARNPEYWKSHQRAYRAEVKLKVLSHYGPEGKLQCSWPDCIVNDIDMLNLDHVNDDGAEQRAKGRYYSTNIIYKHLIRDGFPEGYQTLCANHNWKKELLRRRDYGRGNERDKEICQRARRD